MYDTAVYNRLTNTWVREGKSLSEAAARRRLANRKYRNPSATFMIVSANRRRGR